MLRRLHSFQRLLPSSQPAIRPCQAARGSSHRFSTEPLEPRTLLSLYGGPDFEVNSFQLGDQSKANYPDAVAIDGAGNSVVVYQSLDQAGLGQGYDIFARRFDSAGNALGPEFLVNTTTSGDQTLPLVASDAAGNFVVAWRQVDAIPGMYYARTYRFDGVPLTAPFPVAVPGQETPTSLQSVAIDTAGNIAVLYTNHGGLSFSDPLMVRTFGIDGTPLRPILVHHEWGYFIQSASMAMEPDGDFVVAWTVWNGEGNDDVLAQRFALDGTALTTKGSVSGRTPGGGVDVATDREGNFVVAWHAHSASGASQIFAKRVSASGMLVDEPRFQVDAGPGEYEREVSVTSDAAGNLGFVWEHRPTPQSTDTEIMGRFFRSDGSSAMGPFRVNGSAVGTQRQPSSAMNGSGDWIVSYNENQDVRARLLRPPQPPAPGAISGAVFNDQDADGQRDAGEPPLGGVRVFADENRNGLFDTTRVSDTARFKTPASGGGHNIPANSLRRFVGPAPGQRPDGSRAFGVITDLNLTIGALHYTGSDLDGFLVSPSGRQVQLFNNLRRSLDGVTFDDSATTNLDPVNPQPSGAYRPSQAFIEFLFPPNPPGPPLYMHEPGQWMLELRNASGSLGYLADWSLDILYAEPFGVSDTGGINAGRYTIANVPFGEFLVRQEVPPGWVQTAPASAAHLVRVPTGQTASDLDFGNYQGAGILGHAWHDLNANGRKDAGEPGAPDVVVWAHAETEFRSTDVPRSYATPGSSNSSTLSVSGTLGLITDVDVILDVFQGTASDLVAALVAPSGRRVELVRHAGGLGAPGSHFRGTVLSDQAPTSIQSGTAPFTGVYRPVGSLRDFGGIDADGTWRLEVSGAPGALEGWGLNLVTSTGTGTAPGGAYFFRNMPQGAYTLSQAPPVGMRPTFPLSPGTHRVVLGPTSLSAGNDFGVTGAGEASGHVFHDLNANGFEQGNEPWIGGWRVYADLDGDGRHDVLEPSADVYSQFGFILGGLPLGAPISLRAQPTVVDPLRPWTLTASPAPFTLTGSQPGATGLRFGAFRHATVSGVSYRDLDADGVRDGGELPLPGQRIYLDENSDGQFNDGAPIAVFAGDTPLPVPRRPVNQLDESLAVSTVTLSSLVGTVVDVDVSVDLTHSSVGSLRLVLTSPGGRQVELVRNTGGAGDNFSQTRFDDEATAAIASGAAPFAGSYRPAEPLSALDGETPNGAWTLEVYNRSTSAAGTLGIWSMEIGTTAERYAITDALGRYTLGPITPGNWAVREAPRAEDIDTLPSFGVHHVTLASGQDLTGLDFGNRLNTAPAITPIPDVVVNEDAPDTVIDVKDFFQDAEQPDPALRYIAHVFTNGALFTSFTVTTGGILTIDYAPGAIGTAQVMVAAFDGGYTTENRFNVTVNPVNDPITNRVPGPQRTPVGTPLVLSAGDRNAISVNDDDAFAADVSVTLSLGQGTGRLTLASVRGLEFTEGDGTLDAAMSFTGTLAEVNAALDGLRFDPDPTFAGVATLTVTSDDRGNTGGAATTDTDTVAIDVHPPAVLHFQLEEYSVGEAAGSLRLRVERSGDLGGTVSVDFGAQPPAAGRPATAGADFVLAPGTLTFGPGETAKTLDLTILNDAFYESDARYELQESLVVALSSPSPGAALGRVAAATVTIRDDDLRPTISIRDVTRPEGNTGTTPFVFVLTLNGLTEDPVTLYYQTVDGSDSAQAPGDYIAVPRTGITFAPGETQKQFTVQVVADTIAEPGEMFAIQMLEADNATPADYWGEGWIVDDDAVSVFDFELAAGHAAYAVSESTGSVTFNVLRAGDATGTATVDYVTAPGDATPRVDYAAITGRLTFGPGETSKPVTLTLIDDALDENDESFRVILTNPQGTNATLGANDVARVLIVDEDDMPVLWVTDLIHVREGALGTTTTVQVGIGLSVPSGLDVTFSWVAEPPYASTTPTPGSDFVAASGTVVIPAGQTAVSVPVTVIGDDLVEWYETVFVRLSGISNAMPHSNRHYGLAVGVLYIDDDDGPTAEVVSPGPGYRTTGALPTAMFLFSEPVAGVDVGDFFLTRDGVVVPLSWPNQTLRVGVVQGQAPGAVWTLEGLAPLTASAGDYEIGVRAAGSGIVSAADGAPLLADAFSSWEVFSVVSARHVFYEDSAFDREQPPAAAAPAAAGDHPDDRAIATDKQALLPGQTAGFTNYTTYSKGINGIMIDVRGLPPQAAKISPKDFIFRAGNDARFESWRPAPAPSSISVRRGAGVGGSDRIVLVWGDNAVRRQWLQVTLLPTGITGLADADVFYFGNLPGDTGAGGTGASVAVNAADYAAVRRGTTRNARPGITHPLDFNKDGILNRDDVAVTRANTFSSMRLITPPARAAFSSSEAPAATPPVRRRAWQDQEWAIQGSNL